MIFPKPFDQRSPSKGLGIFQGIRNRKALCHAGGKSYAISPSPRIRLPMRMPCAKIRLRFVCDSPSLSTDFAAGPLWGKVSSAKKLTDFERLGKTQRLSLKGEAFPLKGKPSPLKSHERRKSLFFFVCLFIILYSILLFYKV
jgi:hypothetical protein